MIREMQGSDKKRDTEFRLERCSRCDSEFQANSAMLFVCIRHCEEDTMLFSTDGSAGSTLDG